MIFFFTLEIKSKSLKSRNSIYTTMTMDVLSRGRITLASLLVRVTTLCLLMENALPGSSSNRFSFFQLINCLIRSSAKLFITLPVLLTHPFPGPLAAISPDPNPLLHSGMGADILQLPTGLSKVGPPIAALHASLSQLTPPFVTSQA